MFSLHFIINIFDNMNTTNDNVNKIKLKNDILYRLSLTNFKLFSLLIFSKLKLNIIVNPIKNIIPIIEVNIMSLTLSISYIFIILSIDNINIMI